METTKFKFNKIVNLRTYHSVSLKLHTLELQRENILQITDSRLADAVWDIKKLYGSKDELWVGRVPQNMYLVYS